MSDHLLLAVLSGFLMGALVGGVAVDVLNHNLPVKWEEKR